MFRSSRSLMLALAVGMLAASAIASTPSPATTSPQRTAIVTDGSAFNVSALPATVQPAFMLTASHEASAVFLAPVAAARMRGPGDDDGDAGNPPVLRASWDSCYDRTTVPVRWIPCLRM